MFTFDSFQSILPTVFDFMEFVVVEFGLKMIQDGTRVSDEWRCGIGGDHFRSWQEG